MSTTTKISLSQSLLSYQSLYESVDLPPCPSSVSSESLESILQARLAQLSSCGDPFKRPSPESAKQVDAGSVKAQNGESVSLEAGEKELVLKISSRFRLDQVEAFLLLRSFLRSDDAASLSLPSPPTPLPTKTSAPAALGLSTSVVEQPSPSTSSSLATDLLDHFNLYYFRERLAILKLVAALLRAVEDERHEYFEVAQSIIPQLLAPSSSPDIPSFVQRLFRQFDTHTRTPLPRHIVASSTHSPLWAKQLLKEQLSILEVVFLVLYSASSSQSDPATTEGILVVSHLSKYGQRQENERFLRDQESQSLLSTISGMLVIVCVEVLDLETLLSTPANASLLPPPSPNSLLSSPAHLLSLHHFFLTVGPSPTTSPILVAWSYVLSRLSDSLVNETPEEFIPLSEAILPTVDEEQQPVWQTIVSEALGAKGHLFVGLSELLRGRLFVDAEDGGEGGGNVDLNALGYRSVMKGLMSSLTDLVRVEFLPFDAMVDCWIALYGSGTGTASLCQQFWDIDFLNSPTRRSLLVLARSRFPTLIRPILQLSRSLCGDESSSSFETFEPSPSSAECADIVFRFFAEIPSLSHVLPSNNHVATRGLYVVEPGMQPGEIQYRTQRRLLFPGGIVVPRGTAGRIISPPKTAPVVVTWTAEVSGWRLSLEVLRAYVGMQSTTRVAGSSAGGKRGADEDVFGAPSGSREPSVVISLEEMGIEDCSGEEAVLDILDLFKSVLSSGPSLAAELVAHLSPSSSLASSSSSRQEEESSSDIVQVLFSILERSLSSSARPTPTSSRLISTTLSVLTSLLPAFPGRVWTYLRSSSLLFSNGRSSASTASILASERSIGSYPTTIALVDLVFALFLEAQRSHFVVEHEFLKVKADVLTRALSLIHAEIWTGYTGWKYRSLRERFEIGKKVTTLYDEILRDPTLAPRPSSASNPSGSLSNLQSFLADAFIINSTNLTLAPIVSTLVVGRGLVSGLYASGRVFEAPRAEHLIEGTLRFVRHLLATKRRLDLGKLVPLEQLFFDRSSSSRSAGKNTHASKNGAEKVKTQIVDVVANFVVSPSSSPKIAREAVLLLETLSGSLSTLPGSSPPSIVGHLEDATVTTQAFLDLLADPYQDRDLRRAVWNLLGVLISTQLGWAALFLDMKSHSFGGGVLTASASRKGKEREGSAPKEVNAVSLAQTMVVLWEEYWETDPAFLSSILRFLDVAWENFGDHKALATLRSDPSFWEPLFGIIFRSKLSPQEPDLDSDLLPPLSSSLRANDPTPPSADDLLVLNDQDTRVTSYRNLARAHAVHLFTLDLETTGRRGPLGKGAAGGGGGGAGGSNKSRSSKPASFDMLEKLMLRQKHRLMGGATLRYLRSSCDPELHETVHRSIREAYPGFEVESVRLRLPREERDFGEGYLYSIDVLRQKIEGYRSDQVDDLLIDQTVSEVEAINLDWSLIDSEVACTKAWRQLLTAVIPLFLDGSVQRAEILLRDVRLIAPVIARETRDGDVMLAVHVERMEILRTLVEGTWGTSVMSGSASAKGKAPESSSSSQLESFIGALPDIRNLILSETFPPLESLRGSFSVPFHQTLLQILFLFVRKAVDLPSPSTSSNSLTAQQRLIVHTFLQTTLRFLVLALGSTFERILQTQSSDLDGELSLLVAVFEQAVRPEHDLSPGDWLSLADEIGLVRLSLDVIVTSPWSSSAPSSDESMTSNEDEQEGEEGGVQPRRPLFMEQTLNFHLAMSTIDRGADRLVASNIMAAYSNNLLASVAASGAISPTIKDSFGGAGGHDPVHAAWLVELGVVVNLIGSRGSTSEFVKTEIVPWVHLCGAQLTSSLRWTSSSPVTSAQLQELDSTSILFFTIATSLQSSTRFMPALPVVRAFALEARLVLQHINDLLAHPNHLFASIEPVTDEERFALHKETPSASAVLEGEGLPDPSKRPFLCAVIQRLLLIARTLAFNVNLATRATGLLVNPGAGELEDLVIGADATVSASEPATIGTLMELGTVGIDWHRYLSSRPPPASQAASSSYPFLPTPHLYLPPFSPDSLLPCARDLLEAVSLLAVTQLGLAAKFSTANQRGLADSAGGGGGEMDRLRELAGDVGDLIALGEAKMSKNGDGEGGMWAGVLRRCLERVV